MSLYWNCASWSHLQYCRLIWNTWAKMFPRMLWCCDVVIELPKGMNIFVTQTVLLASSEVWNDSLQCRSQLRCNWDVKPCPLFSAEQVVTRNGVGSLNAFVSWKVLNNTQSFQCTSWPMAWQDLIPTYALCISACKRIKEGLEGICFCCHVCARHARRAAGVQHRNCCPACS